MKKIIVAASALAISLVIVFGSMSSSDARSKKTPPFARSGGPGEQTCASVGCHDTYPNTTTPSAFPRIGWVTSDVPVTGYVPGATYNITVTNYSKGYRHGFEASCQTATGVFMGTLIDNDSTQCIYDPAFLSKQWIGHMDSTRALQHIPTISTTLGTVGTGNNFNQKSWTFQWIAPAAGSGNLNFYLATLSANGNNTDNGVAYPQQSWLGDSVFTSTLALTENTTCSIGGIVKPCNGNNGSATVTATFGTGPYTYLWNPSGQTTQTATALASGTYTVTVTDALSSSMVLKFDLQDRVKANVNDQNIPAACPSALVTHTVVATSGQAPYTYLWSANAGSQTTAAATNLLPGTYSVTVTDANTCATTYSFNSTTLPPIQLWFWPWQDSSVTCHGGANGYAKVQRQYNYGVVTYSWSNGPTTQTNANLVAGTYTCSVTESVTVATTGCPLSTTVTTATVSITEPPTFSATLASQTNVSCNGGTNGAATVSATGGNAPYTYLWAPSGGTAATATGLAPGTYTCTISHRGTYTASQDVPSLQRATSAVGSCSTTVTVTILNPPVVTASVTPNNIACNGGTGSALVTAGGGTPGYTYLWSPSGGTAATASSLAVGSYTATVTDANGCSTTASTTITQPTVVTATQSQVNVSCNGGATGSATVVASGGTPGYTYSWAPSGGTAATASGRTAGTYTCTITDANSCSITKSFAITQPSVVTATQSQVNISCNGGANGSATVVASGGTPGYTYSWAPSGGTAATASGRTAGTYTCTITDANGCSITKSFTLTAPSAIAATSSTTNATCGNANGTATVVASGGTPGYTYAWTPSGGTAATTTGVLAGAYTCTITDANACTFTKTVTIANAGAPTATITSFTNVTCFGGNTGSSSVSASGGVGPYTYSWSPSGGTGTTASNLIAGTYTVTVTDANGCTSIATRTITQPPVITATTSQQNISCNGNCDGSAGVVAAGGNGTYTYAWTPLGGSSASASGFCVGSYTCIISSPAGCLITKSFSITSPTALNASVSQTNVSCPGANDGTITVSNPTGGYGTYEYRINTNPWQPTGNFTNLANATYGVQIRDAANTGCTIFLSNVVITQPGALNATTSKTDVTCNGANDGTITISNPNGGYGTYEYSLNNGPWQYSGSFTGLGDATYSAQIRDAAHAGCSIVTGYQVISEPLVLSAAVAKTDATCNGVNDGSITVSSPAGGYGTYEYRLNTLAWQSSGNFVGLSNGTYSVQIRDAAQTGCVIILGNQIISQPAVLSTAMSSTDEYFPSNGTATALPSGGTGTYSFSWSTTPVQTTQIATGLVAGTYTVTVTDQNGCTVTNTVVVTSAVDVPQVEAGSDIVIFPNPNAGEFDMTLNSSSSNDYTIELRNVLGQVVYSESLENFTGIITKHFDVTVYGRGVYMMSVRSKNQQIVHKVIVD